MKTYPTLFVTALALFFGLGACTPPPPPPTYKPLSERAKPAVSHNTTVRVYKHHYYSEDNKSEAEGAPKKPVRTVDLTGSSTKYHYSSEEIKSEAKGVSKEPVVTAKPPDPSTKKATPKKPVMAESTGDNPDDFRVTQPGKDGKSR